MKLMASMVALVVLACEGVSLSNPAVTPAGGTSAQATSGPAGSSEAVVVKLRLDEAVAVGALRLRWLELNDSRCPVGVQCVWEGKAVVTLEVVRDGEAPQTVELSLRPGTEAPLQVVAGHELRLLDVRPYPQQGVTPNRDEFLAEIDVRSS